MNPNFPQENSPSFGLLRRVAEVAATALGLSALVYDSVDVFRFLTSTGEATIAPFTLICVLAGICLAITWRRDLARHPAVLPSSVLATATFLAMLSLRSMILNQIEREEHASPWLFIIHPAPSAGLILMVSLAVFRYSRALARYLISTVSARSS